MIRIAVIDSTAEARGCLIDKLENFLRIEVQEVQILPRISLKPISIQELKFNAVPDLFILGPELISSDLSHISRIKRSFPNTPLVAWLSQSMSNLNAIEKVARQGVDDVLTFDVTAQYFFRRIFMLSRKAVHQSSGKLLLVDGGKGGVGITTIAAALGELISAQGKRVAIVDCDFETQDCSRFLQARPFINENLRFLLEEERPVTEESVDQCLNALWQDDKDLRCLAPVTDGEDLYDPRSRLPRIFLSILEILDSNHDLVIIDIGCARSALRTMFYRVADKLVFVVNDDPASLYASVEKLTRARSNLSAGAQLCVVENCIGLSGLGNKLLRKEFSRAARLELSDWASDPIPFCQIGKRWPGSGCTFFTQARASASKPLVKLAASLGLVDRAATRSKIKNLFSRLCRFESKETNPKLLTTEDSVIRAGFDSQLTLTNENSKLANFLPEKVRPADSKGLEEQIVSSSIFQNVGDYELESLVNLARPM